MALHVHHRHLTGSGALPRHGEAALAADLRRSLVAALDDILIQTIAGRPSHPIIAALAHLADDDSLLSPAAVMTLNTDGLSDDELTRLRVAILESGTRRMRLAAALGALLGLRSLD